MSNHDADAAFEKGIFYLKQRDVDNAVVWLRRASERDHAQAQFELAFILAIHFGNHTEAFELYEKAANHGHTDALVNLGVCFDQGFGTSQDPARAFECYLAAAEKGDIDGQVNVGDCYAQGKGVTEAADQAARWYVQAGNEGDGTARLKFFKLLLQNGVAGVLIRWPILPHTLHELLRRMARF